MVAPKLAGLVLLLASAAACARGSSEPSPSCPRGDDCPARSERGAGRAPVPAGVPDGGAWTDGGPRGPGRGGACAFGAGALPEDIRRGVERALADERRSESVYLQLDARLGAHSPFRHIPHSERRHASMLVRLLEAHGHAVPGAEPTTAPAAATRREACAFGASSERANIALYDELLARPVPDDVRCVFEHLREASRSHHLPAFERCAAP